MSGEAERLEEGTYDDSLALILLHLDVEQAELDRLGSRASL